MDERRHMGKDKIKKRIVMGIRSLISYEGTDAKSLEEDFHGAVDDYLQLVDVLK